ncbi:hypothetical protein AB0H57_28950 [Micromonospora sp. NPDC050686]|uniref:hypothetical protein n=1 Tax=Micromonospora sp. NPDC050686 TaxID=3154631 RepID=UPI0033F2860F
MLPGSARVSCRTRRRWVLCPHHPDARGEVISDSATLVSLLGPDATALAPWPRLHIADGIDHALAAIEVRLLHRSCILDEHALNDLDALRQQAPDEEALPLVVLITAVPPANASMRAKTVPTLGDDLGVSAVLLGEWQHGSTIDVASKGYKTLAPGPATEPLPPRLPVLDSRYRHRDSHHLARGANRGSHQAALQRCARPAVPVHASRTHTASPGPQAPATATVEPHATGKAHLRVLGPPCIDNITKQREQGT